jgi:hypothetical protein
LRIPQCFDRKAIAIDIAELSGVKIIGLVSESGRRKRRIFAGLEIPALERVAGDGTKRLTGGTSIPIKAGAVLRHVLNCCPCQENLDRRLGYASRHDRAPSPQRQNKHAQNEGTKEAGMISRE